MQTVTLATGETLTFSEAEHLYLCDGKPMPGTHSLMERHGIVKPLDQWGAPYAERGKRIHFITQAWDENDLDLEDVDSTDRPFLEGWIRFSEEYKVKWEGIEALRGSANYWAATVIDRIGLVLSKHSVVNIKTTTDLKNVERYHRAHAVQLAIEAILEGTPDMLAVYLDPFGGHFVKFFTEDRDYKMACSILQTNGMAHSYMTTRRNRTKETAR